MPPKNLETSRITTADTAVKTIFEVFDCKSVPMSATAAVSRSENPAKNSVSPLAIASKKSLKSPTSVDSSALEKMKEIFGTMSAADKPTVKSTTMILYNK